ncbi:hypothetical protein PILCRDRAFT_819095 [Piloderma croceum F 1598]|uniref:Uncharacterized protein n=1 Tax=Piloderma croceum (strain F 1598) TaxID=765440 RepID=A0A0C3FYW5_PILCF|nr:hypothetical protein PILCRDRAFT_819095 [Piloderma croceum F 1598]
MALAMWRSIHRNMTSSWPSLALANNKIPISVDVKLACHHRDSVTEDSRRSSRSQSTPGLKRSGERLA